MIEVMPSAGTDSGCRVARYKLLPVVDPDACRGCGKCVRACPTASIDMDWHLARLVRPGDCTSEGRCVDACPHGGIEMQWLAMTGNAEVGEWCEDPPSPVLAPAVRRARARFWPVRLFLRAID